VPQVYPGIERGTVDGAMIPVTTLLDFKLAEVVKYITTEAPLGRSAFLVSMQKKRYEGLPAELRKVIDDTTGLELALQGAATYDNRAAEAMKSVAKSHDVYLLSKAEYARSGSSSSLRSLRRKRSGSTPSGCRAPSS
jgi:TRAP-type transport system periplasmic protein